MPKSRGKRVRYQPPPKPRPKPSPRWFGPLLLSIMLLGVLVIVLNYMNWPLLGWSTNNLFLWIGLGLIATGFMLATQWR
jgi:hypothetical protein